MLINTLTYPETVDLVRRQFDVINEAMFDSPIEQIFKVEEFPAMNGNSINYTEFSTDEYASKKREGDAAAYADKVVGYSKTLTIGTIAKHVKITKEMRLQNRYQEVVKTINDVSRYCPNRIDLDAANRISYSNVASYVDMDGDTIDLLGGDGVTIINSAHPLKASSTTWSNVITGNPEFDEAGDALAVALKVGQENAYNHFGENISIEYDTILTSDDYTVVKNVSTLLRSTSWVNPSVSSNTSGQNAGVINYWQGMFKHIIWPRLAFTATGSRDATKAKAWFLISSSVFPAHLVYLQRPSLVTEDPTVGNVEGSAYDFDTYDWKFGSTAMYGMTIVTGRGILGSFPA